jgi:hypothetical protein
VLLFLATACLAQFVPEHLLQQTETELSLRGRFAQSSVTVPPSGAGLREDYREIGLDIDARLGLFRFLTVTIGVPAVQHVDLRNGLLATTRVGDPMVGVYAGGALHLNDHAQVQLFPFAELSFPSTQQQILFLSNTIAPQLDHGVVVDTGGIDLLAGAVAAYRAEWARLAFESSLRGYYRVRGAGASDGMGFDARARLVLHHFWLVGAQVAGLFAIGGSDPAFISPSRVGDAASWVDLGLLFGVRPLPWLDTQVVFAAPLYARGSGELLQGTLQVLFHWTPAL